GHSDLKFVTLEEQLVIFLYTCVTGLMVRHVGECFQWSNDTISWYFKKLFFIFSALPFYFTYAQFPAGEAIHLKI
ncbi:hypothetical protein M404DRAFT_163032, partial [Pisolithus tinctorius Marx 270]